MTVRYRLLKEKAAIIICSLGALFAVGMLFLILGDITVNAIPSLSLSFLITPENQAGLGQGIANAVVGTIILSLCATVLATPFAICTAIYLRRYAPENRLTDCIRFMIEVMSGTPSVVVGMFALLVLVIYLKPFTGGFSLIAGMIALAILIIPVIERAIESAIETVNPELEEGSYALGATKWQTISGVTLPSVISGIMTALILGFGRAAEESSVVVLTAGYSQFIPQIGLPHNSKFFFGIQVLPFNQVIASLPYAVYNAYEETNVIPMSNAYAIAFFLIVFVLLINILAKIIGSHAISSAQGRSGGPSSLGSYISSLRNILPLRTDSRENLMNNNEKIPDGRIIIADKSTDSAHSAVLSETGSVDSRSSVNGNSHRDPIGKKFTKIWSEMFRKNRTTGNSPVNSGESPIREIGFDVRTFLRPLLPFAIPAAILLLITVLATIPPLHHILGPASPSLAGLFATGLAVIVTVAGLIFGFLFAKRSGAFKEKNRRAGYAAVASGFCLLCIAGIICSSAAAGLFNTGDAAAASSGGDRAAKLAALAAAGDQGDGSASSVSVQNIAPTVPAQNLAVTQVPGTQTTPTVPVKDALGIGEYYWYGDAQHTVRATVYDYKVLPFYFWWFIDYNRFVQQTPPTGYSYLVVFIRMEDVGKKSTIVPSADQIMVTNNGNTYPHEPFFNKSVLSSYQSDYYSTHYNDLPYQWIREIGQDKRDYAFLTFYNIFGNDWATAYNMTVTPAATVTAATVTVSDTSDTTVSTSTSAANNGQGFFLHPGSSNAIDGYMIYTVPNTAVDTPAHLKSTYVQISFNNFSASRWQLGTDVPAK